MPDTRSILEFPLGYHPQSHVYAQITADFILDGNLKTYRARLSHAFGTATAKNLYEHIDRILGSVEAKMTWRALAHSMRNGTNFEDECRRFKVPVDVANDIVFLSSDAVYDGVAYLADENFVIDEFTRTEERQFLNKLTSYARRIAFTKLKFLAHYDVSTDIEDYVQSLLVKGMTTVWRYSHFTRDDGSRDSLKILNYAKATLSNTALSIIRSSTLERRARIRNHVDTGCGTCAFCKRGNPGGCWTTSPNYESVVVSSDTVGVVAAEDTTPATDARMMLVKLISTDARIASAFSKTFGTVDVDTVIARCDSAAERKFMNVLSSLPKLPYAHAS